MSTASLSVRLRMPLDRFELDVDLHSHTPALGLFGASGSGKTTVLEAIAGWRSVVHGHIELAGRTLLDTAAGVALPLDQRRVGYVPQDLLLFPHWSVERNVRAGLARARGRTGPAGSTDAGVARVLAVLELEDLIERTVGTLSGGERQRVALARALCSGPDLLLLDEPLGALDLPLRRRILPYLVRVREELGTPMLFVSHDATEVSVVCDDVAVLDRGQVVMRGAPEEVFSSPAFAALAQVAGTPSGTAVENVLRGTVSRLARGTAVLELEGGTELVVPRSGLARGARCVASVRSDDVLVATRPPEGLSARNVLPARVTDVIERPEELLLRAELRGGGAALFVQLTEQAVAELGLKPALPVHLVIETSSCRVLSSSPPDRSGD